MFRLRPVPGSVPHRLAAIRPTRSLPASTFRSLSNNAGGKIVTPTSSTLSQNFFAGHHRPSLKPHYQLNPVRTRTTFRIPSIPSEGFADKHPYVSVTIRLVLSSVLGLVFLTGAILVHDASTYSERHVDRVPCNPLSLKPRVGGKKNLPIIEVNLDDEEDETKRAMKGKPRLVVIGGGWGAVSLIQSLPAHAYNVTLISPQTYFAFTPLLPSACVGTVEPRSLVEPLRKLVARVRGHYLMGAAVDLDMTERLVEVEVPKEDGQGTMRCYVPYDKLVIAVGSTTNNHGVKGLEHCYQLKTVPDAQAIRRKVMDNLELASLPTTTPEERKKLLSFVVCGGGPTGVEFAAELADMMAEDVLKYYPKILSNEVQVTVIQSRDHILNTYSEKISQYAEKRFARNDVRVIINARVQEVKDDRVILSVKDSNNKDAKPEVKELEAGFVLWSTGIAMQPFTKRLVELLPNQYHSKAVEIDGFLRVQGAPQGSVYALGDASTVQTNLMKDLYNLWDKFDINKDGNIDYEEWQEMVKYIKKKHPLAHRSLTKMRAVFEEFDRDHDEKLSLDEVAELFAKLSKKVTSYPATAQVASQQGKYLGAKFGKLAKQQETLSKNGIVDLDDESYYHPFEYQHLGSLAYIGNSAVFDYEGWSLAGGLLAMYAWRSIYWSEQTSMRTRMLLMLDWVKRGIFGRDLSKF
ncbi:NADH dehydrogenase [Cryptococcus gattii Ru294]|uniref:64 kDa mitochondrial NADH dehydrogenase, putative n=2 Tax=Cryptococcus gattii TaxID=37769 RepID=E6R9Y9_CRYGW|nr:64 kDa mitochondrial NADH dehydrogenase, putative [Cryptococcus gattii WM276]KIR54689.1 NADH dehydrogenase [Cryptococcus gattii Ru294]KIR77729.1 NADH dehydrogenase [Cryptococcus gattii EJB2]KIY36035.1 NADH dehydrogenase [Cryptococcus gattii E566]KJE05533.1 NADH dehydrogenase [Cryptococcus gattii NT-10]ADV23606.1 64 kDa mitochondrial NADH dehydrogenase, putative [Cryptococcus gattii WM276]